MDLLRTMEGLNRHIGDELGFFIFEDDVNSCRGVRVLDHSATTFVAESDAFSTCQRHELNGWGDAEEQSADPIYLDAAGDGRWIDVPDLVEVDRPTFVIELPLAVVRYREFSEVPVLSVDTVSNELPAQCELVTLRPFRGSLIA